MIPAAARAPGPDFVAGWYGKIPSTGDFIARRIPSAFTLAWDRWLQPALEGTRATLAGHWRDDFLSMPVWRFVFSARLVASSAWAGVILPSVDSVGRYYPLTIVSALPAERLDLVGTLFAARRWFADIEQVALAAIAPAADPAAVDAAIAARPFSREWLRRGEDGERALVSRAGRAQMLSVGLPVDADGEAPSASLRALAARLGEPRAAWLAEPSEVCARTLLLCGELPPAEQLCAMLNGRWLEHGWTRHDAPLAS